MTKRSLEWFQRYRRHYDMSKGKVKYGTAVYAIKFNDIQAFMVRRNENKRLIRLTDNLPPMDRTIQNADVQSNAVVETHDTGLNNHHF